MVQIRAKNRKRKLPAQQHVASTSTAIRRYKVCTDGISYFKWLPKDAIHNIIRFTSERPRKPIWQAHVKPEVALTLLESDSVLSCSAIELFRSLEVREFNHAYPPEPSTSIMVLAPWERNKRLFLSLLSKLRRTLTEVKIERDIYSQDWTQSLTSKFPELKRLCISFHQKILPLIEILAAQGNGLEALQLNRDRLIQDEVDAIAQCCKGLKVLVLQVGETGAYIGKIWKSLGSTLEDVSLRNSYNKIDFDLPSITKNCKKIERLAAFRFQPESHDELEALCQSLGGQLEHLILDWCDIDAVRLGRIATACKNVAMDLKQQGDCTSSSPIEMGSTASRVSIVPDDMEELRYDCQSLALASRLCKNLVGVRISGNMPEECFRAFFAEPKPTIKEFEGMNFKLPNGGCVFEVLASKVSSLQTFSYSGTLPAAPVLLEFIKANPLLEVVKLWVVRAGCYCRRRFGALYGDEDDENTDLGPRFDLGMAAKIFLKSKRLTTLSIWCKKKFVTRCDNSERRREDHFAACLGARKQNIEVKICGHVYW